jgi:hypothetical protein
LPFSELAFHKDRKYDYLILTDDKQYYEAESLEESFAYLPKMLAHKDFTKLGVETGGLNQFLFLFWRKNKRKNNAHSQNSYYDQEGMLIAKSPLL